MPPPAARRRGPASPRRSLRQAARLGVPQVPVIPITTAEYPLPAKRPANSRLDCAKLERTFGVRLPPWQQGVAECIAELESVPAA